MKVLLIVAPVVALYSPTVPLKKFVTNTFPPENAMPYGPFVEMKALLTVAPEVVYSPTVLPLMFATNRFPPDNARPSAPFNPEIKALLTVAPEVVYSPIVLLPKFATKIWPRLVAGMTQSAAAT